MTPSSTALSVFNPPNCIARAIACAFSLFESRPLFTPEPRDQALDRKEETPWLVAKTYFGSATSSAGLAKILARAREMPPIDAALRQTLSVLQQTHRRPCNLCITTEPAPLKSKIRGQWNFHHFLIVCHFILSICD